MDNKKPIYVSHKSEAIMQMKHLAEEMLKNPELAEKAIHDRNIIIKGLKADIEHRKIAFKEIESRYTELLERNNTLETTKIRNVTLTKEFTDLKKELEETKKELETEKSNNPDRKWAVKIEKFVDPLPKMIGNVIKFVFTPPMSTYLWLIIFAVFFIASITGWGFVATALTPLFKLFSILIPG